MLHIVNKSPLEKDCLASCLRHVAQSSASDQVLLIEDAIVAATQGHKAAKQLTEALNAGVKINVLLPDLAARGLSERVLDGVKTVDYAGFVALACAEPNVQSWL